MAGRKLNEIDFILNAQMNSGFHGTFTKAQAEFAKLGGEIAELHRAQSNVAAYQKQQGAIAATEDKLVNLKKQYALLQTEIDETTGVHRIPQPGKAQAGTADQKRRGRPDPAETEAGRDCRSAQRRGDQHR